MSDIPYILGAITAVIVCAYLIGSFLSWTDRQDRWDIHDVFDDDDQDSVG